MAPTIVVVVPEDSDRAIMPGFDAAKRMLPMRILKSTAAHDAVGVIQVWWRGEGGTRNHH